MIKVSSVDEVIYRGRVHDHPRNAVVGEDIAVVVSCEHSGYFIWAERADSDETTEFRLQEAFGHTSLHARDSAIEFAVHLAASLRKHPS